jgi:biofilm PGA synthesis N-glycosyltransferase PgaC
MFRCPTGRLTGERVQSAESDRSLSGEQGRGKKQVDSARYDILLHLGASDRVLRCAGPPVEEGCSNIPSPGLTRIGAEAAAAALRTGARRALGRPRTGSGRRSLMRAGTCRAQFAVSLLFACTWTVFSVGVSQPWLGDLGLVSHPLAALFALTFVAYVPGFMNAFLLASLVFQPGTRRRRPLWYPGVSVLIAAYQEEEAIAETLRSVREVGYPGPLEVIVLDDGSNDGTSAAVDHCRETLFRSSPGMKLRRVRFDENRGKARTLNSGLEQAGHELIVTIDADTRLEPGSLTALVERLLTDGPDTVAVAGAVLVGNPRESLAAGAQQWDYFHGIAAVKRMQSMYGGTLVAQGAFSVYLRRVLVDVGGWPDTVGEDIVLTWALLRRGHRIGYAEDAIAWTHAPPTWGELARQRKRWARGMIEALTHHKALLFQPRLTTMFIWWNLLFITLDLTFTAVFLPGLILAVCGFYWLAGPITLLVLPLAALWNLVIFRIQTRMLKRMGIRMERSFAGFIFFALAYPVLMQPVSLWGYAAELSGRTKEWGGT